MNLTYLFNGPLEVGLRSLLLLLEAHPRPIDLQRLVILDYLLVHSGDLPGGPPSLHPPSPLRAGEVSIRRELVQQGLHLLTSKGLVGRRVNDTGIHYVAEDLSPTLVDAFTSPYVHALRDRARWAVETAGAISDEAANALLDATIGRWRTEFVAMLVEDEI